MEPNHKRIRRLQWPIVTDVNDPHEERDARRHAKPRAKRAAQSARRVEQSTPWQTTCLEQGDALPGRQPDERGEQSTLWQTTCLVQGDGALGRQPDERAENQRGERVENRPHHGPDEPLQPGLGGGQLLR